MNKSDIVKNLEKSFFGINDQIDQICEMVAPWSDLPDSYIRPLIINLWGMTGTGKAQPLYSKIRVPNGWKKMGNIKVGDEVLTPQNTVTKVTGVFPQGVREVYRISFEDGRSVECCGKHLWKVHIHKGLESFGDEWQVLSTESLIEENLDKDIYIPLCSAIENEVEEHLPLVPYQLGVSLVKGYAWGDQLQILGFDDIELKEKFIYDEYKNGSIETRLNVLRGILDTAGTVCSRTCSVYFSSVSERLAQDVCDVIYSLGGRAKILKKKSVHMEDGEYVEGSLSYKVNIDYRNIGDLFSPSKRSELSLSSYQRQFQIPETQCMLLKISNIEYIGDEECQCIMVEDQNHLYLTDNYIVTHNTSLVRELAKVLDVPLVELDLGEFVGGDHSDGNFSKNFFEKYYELSNKPCIILLDEFHIVRTISDDEGEIDREKLRGLWSLLSDGTIVINSKTEREDDFDYIFDDAIEGYIDDQVEIKRLSVSNDKDDKEELRRLQKQSKIWYFTYGPHIVKYFCKVAARDYKQIRDDLEKDFLSTVQSMKKDAAKLGFQPKLDYRKALIFISGNLDKIYKSVYDFDPDLDLESIYEHSKILTVSDVKNELTSRFRPEQLGRLGNNHIIYYALNKESYLKIIQNDLKRISNFFKKRKDIRLSFSFSKDVAELVYREGVVPAQGARSVLSTIGTLIEPKVIRYVIDHRKIIPNPNAVSNIIVNYDKGNNILNFKGEYLESSVSPKLNFDELRRPNLTNRSVMTAAHEAGHVLACCLRFGLVPNRASAFTVGNDKGGIVEYMSNLEEDVMNKDRLIAGVETALAGVVAEKIMFGEGKETLGSESDIAKATSIALTLVCHLDHNNTLTNVRLSGQDYPESINRSDKYDELALQIIQSATKDVERLIFNNKKLFLDMTEALLTNSFLSKNEIIKILKKNKSKVAERFSYIDAFTKFKNKSS